MSTSAPRFTSPRRIIERSFRRIGVTGETETPTDAQMKDGFDYLCLMLSNWRTNPQTQHGIRRHVFTDLEVLEPDNGRPHLILTDTELIAGAHVIRFAIKPTWLLGISWLSTPTSTRPLLPIPVSTWTAGGTLARDRGFADLNTDAISFSQRGDPQFWFFDGDYEEVNDDGEEKLVGAGRLYLVPAPTGSFSLAIHARRSVLQFDDVDDEVSMPDGYEAAVHFNLAKWLAGEWGRTIDKDLRDMADSTLRDIKAVQEARPDTVAPEPIFAVERQRVRHSLYGR